jgi:hypothetical protein
MMISGLISPCRNPHILLMTSWKPREPKTKGELREMLAEAVRNTQPQPQPEIKKPVPKAKKGRRQPPAAWLQGRFSGSVGAFAQLPWTSPAGCYSMGAGAGDQGRGERAAINCGKLKTGAKIRKGKSAITYTISRG